MYCIMTTCRSGLAAHLHGTKDGGRDSTKEFATQTIDLADFLRKDLANLRVTRT